MIIGVMQVHRITVGKHKFDPTEGVCVAGELDEAVGDGTTVFGASELGKAEWYLLFPLKDMDIVGFEIAWIGTQDGDEIAADEVVGDGPSGVEYHVLDPITEDRSRAVDASDDEGAGEDRFATLDVAKPIVRDVHLSVLGFEVARVELEDVEVGEDLFEIEALGLIEIEDHLVVDVIPFGEVEAGFEASDGLGEAAAPAGTGIATGKIAKKMEPFFDGTDSVVHAVRFEQFSIRDLFPLGHGAVFFQQSNELLVAVGLGDMCREKWVNLAAGEGGVDAPDRGHPSRVDFPRGADILRRFEAGHFALDQSPVDIPDPDEMEQAEIRIGQGDVELLFDSRGLDIAAHLSEQAVDPRTVERFVFVVEVGVVDQIEQGVELLRSVGSCPKGTVAILGIEGFECLAKRAFGMCDSSIIWGSKEQS